MSLLDIITSILVSGSICGSLGFAIGLGFRPGLLKRVELFVHELIKVEIDNFLENLKSNPKFVKELTQPFMNAVSSEFGIDSSGKREQSLKIGGFKIPKEIVNLGISMLTQQTKNRVIDVVPSLLTQE